MSQAYDLDGDKQYGRVYRDQTPDVQAAFGAFNDAVFAHEGRTIPLKYRELIAVAVALTTQCVYCIDGHTAKAVAAGATETELAETAWVAAALRAGGAYAHGRLAFKFAQAAGVPAHAH